MKKKQAKQDVRKLTLSKETLQNLSPEALREIQGAGLDSHGGQCSVRIC